MGNYAGLAAIGVVVISLGFILGAVIIHVFVGTDEHDMAVIGAVTAVIAPTITSLLVLLKTTQNTTLIEQSSKRVEDLHDKTDVLSGRNME